jgi:pilus assembly protein CpaF
MMLDTAPARGSAASPPNAESRNALVAAAHDRLLRDLDLRVLETLDPVEARVHVEAATGVVLAEIAPSLAGVTKEQVITSVVHEVVGFGPMQPLLDDPEISEVMVNGPSDVYFERDGILYASSVRFRDEQHILRIADRIVAGLGRRIDEASPMVDARLPDGSRVNIVVPPVAVKSPTITVRKFQSERFGIEDLIRIGTITGPVAGFVRACVIAKVNLVISGGTGTGKTTFLNALTQFIPDGERIVTTEDPIEIQPRKAHVIPLEARPPGVEGRGAVTSRDLVRNSLRMRPDRIVIGEVRGSEAFDMLQAMNTGHEGSITTVHANTPRDALSRIENMVMMAGFELPTRAIREQMASALHLILQVNRLADGSRRVVALSEVAGMEGDVVVLQDLFTFDNRGLDADGRVMGELSSTGIRPSFAERFETLGISTTWDTRAPTAVLR